MKFIKRILRFLGILKRPYTKLPPDFSRRSLISNTTLKDLKDPLYLEHNLIPGIGLNNELLEEFPESLYKYCGQGFFVWQYPNQLSKYFSFLSNLPVTNYLEIGVRHGGTFLLTKFYLEKVFNRELDCFGIDISESPFLKENQEKLKYNYSVVSSQSEEFIEMIRDKLFDLVFIDGDHEYEACKKDFERMKDRSDIIVFHDIVSDVCSGVVKMWGEVKENPAYHTFEFTDQYEEVYKRTGKKYLGIGLALNKNSKFCNYVG